MAGLRYGKCDQKGCTTPEGFVIAKSLPSSGKWCESCNRKRLADIRQSNSSSPNHPFRKGNDQISTRKKDSGQSLLKNLVKKLDSLFSLYIRQRDADDLGYAKCCTCGNSFHWEDMDCGHWISRGTFSIRFDERNCHVQCRKCNREPGENGELAGRPEQFERFIASRYGQCVVEELKALKNSHFKIDRNWMNGQIKKYSDA